MNWDWSFCLTQVDISINDFIWHTNALIGQAKNINDNTENSYLDICITHGNSMQQFYLSLWEVIKAVIEVKKLHSPWDDEQKLCNIAKSFEH